MSTAHSIPEPEGPEDLHRLGVEQILSAGSKAYRAGYRDGWKAGWRAGLSQYVHPKKKKRSANDPTDAVVPHEGS